LQLWCLFSYLQWKGIIRGSQSCISRANITNGRTGETAHRRKGLSSIDLVSGKKVTLTDVLYVPKCISNLISIRQLDSKGVKTTITGGSLKAQLANGKPLFSAENHRGLYVLDVQQTALTSANRGFFFL
jgi:hypothetical protein